jgi:glycosyltransferase involved in cell wall biosynthesis
MRIAFFAPAPWQTISGGYVYDRAIVAGLRGAGHAVEIVALPGSHPLPDAVALAAAAASWATLAPDDVAVIDGLALPAFAPLAEALAARGTVALIHHPTSLETGLSEATREALHASERRLFPLLRRAIVTSADTAKRLVDQFDVAASRIVVVEPATPAAPRSDGPSRPGCLILSVATLSPRKGHDVLLRALSRLMDLDWRLVIVGGAPDPILRQQLEALTAELGLAERVEFAGEIAPEHLAPYWEQAGIFALATYYEGYGMAIAEALRRGIPVAVTAGGAAATLVAPECGVICEPGDHAGLSRAMRRMIYDRPLRLDMAAAAWRVGETLPDWETQARRFAEALED